VSKHSVNHCNHMCSDKTGGACVMLHLIRFGFKIDCWCKAFVLTF
jgi:hypothetical protein